MTIAASPPRGIAYAGNGSTASFDVPFIFYLASDLRVALRNSAGAETDMTLNSHYSVTGGSGATGTVSFVTAPASGMVVVIQGRMPIEQDSDFPANGRFPSATVERALDKMTVVVQEQQLQIEDVASRAPQVPAGQTAPVLDNLAGNDGALMRYANDKLEPLPAAPFAGKFFAGDATGKPVPASGTGGGDAALRGDLAGDDGAALSGYKPSGGIRKSLAEFLLSLRRTVSYLTLGSAITALGNGVVHLAPGTYTAATIPSRTNGLIGSGIGAAVINPTSATGIALTSTANGGGWDFAIVENLSIEGIGTRQGIGYQFGPTSYTAGAEYTGRTVFDRVGFSNHDKCINRPWGSIGLYTRNCQFGSANYHLFVTANVGSGGGGSGDVMHAGTAFLVGDNCQGAQIASNYIDGRSVIGTCQFNQRDRILEGIPGWCHYFRNCNSAGGFPHFLIDGEYIENNYTATSVTTPDGNTRAPKYLYALNTTSIVISNSCPGPMVLDGSNVTTIGCDLTNVVNCELTNNATLAHHMARSFNSQVDGLTYSIAAVLNETSLAAPCYAMPVPSGFGAGGGTVLFVKNAQSAIAFTGSTLRNTTTVAGSALPGMDKVQRLTINNNETLLPTTSVTLPANKYFVVQYVARKVSGPTVSVQISGLYTFGRQVAISSTTLRTYTQILKAESVDRTSSLYHFNGGATSVIEIGGIAIVAFDTMQEALAYANSGLIAQEPRAAITLAAYTAATAFDPATATLADTANMVATLIAENQKGRLLT